MLPVSEATVGQKLNFIGLDPLSGFLWGRRRAAESLLWLLKLRFSLNFRSDAVSVGTTPDLSMLFQGSQYEHLVLLTVSREGLRVTVSAGSSSSYPPNVLVSM